MFPLASPIRRALAGGAVAIVIAACGGSASPRPTASMAASIAPGGSGDATACSPDAGTGATVYPGWPGSGQVTADAPFIPIVVSSELSAGPNRFLVTVIDQQNNNIASADASLKLSFYDLAASSTSADSQADAEFLDTGTPAAGLYHAPATFPCWGEWGVEATFARLSGSGSARVIFDVRPTSSTPAVGAKAPPADSPTATDAAGIAAISTDTTPDADYYRMTITQAEAAGKPSVIAFSTPAFCQSATCGPTLDRIQAIGESYKADVNFVHVEPYLLEQTPTGLQPALDAQAQLQVVPAVTAFGLPTEPFTFVLDAQGRVAAKFDGIMGEDELRAALDGVTGGTELPPAAAPSVSATSGST